MPTEVGQCLQAGFLDLCLVDYTECVSELLNPISTHFRETLCYNVSVTKFALPVENSLIATKNKV